MNAIVGSSADPAHLNVLRDWFRAEWGEEVVLDSGGATAPGPLVAIAEGELLGGLAFTSFRRPGSESPGIWINALFVAPRHRRRGLASRLIRAAEAEAARAGESELYALTDIPALYEKLGWLRSRADSAGTVMVRAIGK